MKRAVVTVIIGLLASASVFSAEPKPLEKQKWGHVCSGKMPEEWYASDQARNIADIVVAVQKTTGGWGKNDQMHKLTEEQMMTITYL